MLKIFSNAKLLLGLSYSVFCLALFSATGVCNVYANKKIQLQQTLNALIQKYNIPGAVLAYKIGRSPTVVVSAGYASVVPQKKMTGNALFLVGSITKSFTAALLLRLVDQHKISLDEHLQQIARTYPGHIRSLVSHYPVLGAMTLRELLNHTSGVPQSINTHTFKSKFAQNPHKYYTPKLLMTIAMQHPVYFKPGAKGKWSYTNTDYILVGLVIEDVSQHSLAKNLTDLLKKLSLNNIYFANNGIAPTHITHRIASGYIATNSSSAISQAFKHCKIISLPNSHVKLYQLHDAYNIFSPSASGIIATAPALVAWYEALFESHTVMSPQSRQALLQVVRNGKYNDAGYGLGVTVHTYPNLGKVISHDGLEPGYSSIVFFFQKKHLILSMTTNSSNNKVSTFNVHNGAIIPGLVTQLLPYITGPTQR